jgi:hypothetical protein
MRPFEGRATRLPAAPSEGGPQLRGHWAMGQCTRAADGMDHGAAVSRRHWASCRCAEPEASKPALLANNAHLAVEPMGKLVEGWRNSSQAPWLAPVWTRFDKIAGVSPSRSAVPLGVA